MIVINLKAYEKGIGDHALEIARIADRVSRESGVKIAVAAQHVDLRSIAREVSIDVYAQHVDPIAPGSKTGWILPEGIAAAGAAGTIINHAERMVDKETIKECISLCKRIGLKTICCVVGPEEAEKIAQFGPDFISIEDPRLIGGTVSVSTANPQIITESVVRVKAVNPGIGILCGAGVHSAADTKEALALGTQGVILASVIMRAHNVEATIRDLAHGMK